MQSEKSNTYFSMKTVYTTESVKLSRIDIKVNWCWKWYERKQ